MSKYGPCRNGLASCGPAIVVWMYHGSGSFPLCRPCLDAWLDNADDDPSLEPDRLIWMEPFRLTDERISRALRDPRNRDHVAAVLLREARTNPTWLANFIRTQERRTGSPMMSR